MLQRIGVVATMLLLILSFAAFTDVPSLLFDAQPVECEMLDVIKDGQGRITGAICANSCSGNCSLQTVMVGGSEYGKYCGCPNQPTCCHAFLEKAGAYYNLVPQGNCNSPCGVGGDCTLGGAHGTTPICPTGPG